MRARYRGSSTLLLFLWPCIPLLQHVGLMCGGGPCVGVQQSSVEWCSSLWLKVAQEVDPGLRRTVIVASKFDNRLKEFAERWEVSHARRATAAPCRGSHGNEPSNSSGLVRVAVFGYNLELCESIMSTWSRSSNPGLCPFPVSSTIFALNCKVFPV